MKIIPADTFPDWDKPSLKRFLTECQQASKDDGHLKIASISMAVRHIDPLAVLESIYEPRHLHFYCEHPQQDMAVAGAEAVMEATFSGDQRFQQVKAFASGVLEHTIAIGDLSLPFAGPHFFTGFTFADKNDSDEVPFAPATVFLPRWQVARQQGLYSAVANVPVTPEVSVDLLADKVWAAHEKFCAFNYASQDIAHRDRSRFEADAKPVDHSSVDRNEVLDSGDSLCALDVHEVGGRSWFQNAVKCVLEDIRAGWLEKIVLARAIELHASRPLEPLTVLDQLRERFQGCYSFSMANGNGSSFIGSSPERLMRLAEGHLLTEAIAGSAPRGHSACEDAEHAQELFRSDKDFREHNYVIESIKGQLSGLVAGLEISSPSQLIKLHNVQHLKTVIEGQCVQGVHLLDLLARLHPTSAVGGIPLQPAGRRIAELEPFERGLYAGALGWFDFSGEGEYFVAIRSALIQNDSARLYAGVGIVEGSVPEREQQETNWKLEALWQPLRKIL